MDHRFSHVAVTVTPDQIQGSARSDLLRFYGELLGWTENPRLSRAGQRLFLRAPTDTQYLTIRAAEEPMQTSGYEHLGVLLDSAPELRAVHGRASALASDVPTMELGELRSLYDDALLTFRLRYCLPLTLEFQHIARQ